ncbi:CBU_0592 family membrane protein [Nonomuraea sp. LPB2021202275-12-8]|uniref:CBU_0592 family membrane protein n=1 Tax=Nonomuraea sp. LPB2021202275-12-8 TaxID=3120159 RepID=UPI00300C9341
MDLVIAALGWIGAALLVAGYGMVSTSRMSGDGLAYQLINLVGSVSLMVNSAYNDAWPSAGLNLVWAAIGVMALVKLLRLKVLQ